MSVKYQTYNPSGFFKNGHFNTIYASIRRKVSTPDIQRVRINTPDHDFLDLDWIKINSKHLVILGHGLEGSSDSIYMKAAANIFTENGFDVLLINQRSCSGEINLAPTIYHSGYTDDLEFIISEHCDPYQKIHLVGFSMGGNIMLKFIGQKSKSLDKRILSCIAVSSPVHLSSSSKQLRKLRNRIYEKNFLKTLRTKIKLKQQQYPDFYPKHRISEVNTIYDFDNIFTAPIHGFKDASDYYQKSSSIQYLKDIKIPATIISSLDDPFLGEECYPFEEALDNPNLHLMITKHGGHCGFYTRNSEFSWLESKLLYQVNQFNEKLKKLGPSNKEKRPNNLSSFNYSKKRYKS